MKGIRWITGVPLCYFLYKYLVLLNFKLIVFLSDKISFIPDFLWEIEYLFLNTLIFTYLSLVILYFYLPRDEFALQNNNKVKLIYWAVSLLTVIELIVGGSLIYQAIHDYQEGMIYRILYPPLLIIFMWLSYKGIEKVDFNHNQPARDYYLEQRQLYEEQIAASK